MRICFCLNLEFSNLVRASGEGSRHSGMKMMKESGSTDSDKTFSKWSTITLISSSLNGGLAAGRNGEVNVSNRLKA